MTNLASFRINQASNPIPVGTYGIARRDMMPYTEGGEITFEAENSGLVYRWELIQPPGGTGVLSGVTGQTATLVAEQDGGYIVKLTVNPSTPNEDIDLLYFGIPTIIDDTSLCLPALNETTQDNSIGHPEYGWWEKNYEFLRVLAGKAGTGGSGDTFFEAGTGPDSLQRINFAAASGDYSWALGYGSEAQGAYSWSFGVNSYALENYSYTFGFETEALLESYVFGVSIRSAFPYSLSIGHNNADDFSYNNPQAVRIPLNAITSADGMANTLYVDPAMSKNFGPVEAYSYMNINFHIVAKTDNGSGYTSVIATFDGTIRASATADASGIVYHDWTVTKSSSAGTRGDLWDIVIPASSTSRTKIEIQVIPDTSPGDTDVIWSGYADVAIVGTYYSPS
jgi:hypothetical protein